MYSICVNGWPGWACDDATTQGGFWGRGLASVREHRPPPNASIIHVDLCLWTPMGTSVPDPMCAPKKPFPQTLLRHCKEDKRQLVTFSHHSRIAPLSHTSILLLRFARWRQRYTIEPHNNHKLASMLILR